ncbi:MAG: histidinol dehydrogenase [Bacillaceae bacterium]
MFRYFKFRLNDTVQFQENDGHTYRIVGYRLERSFTHYEESTTIIYELVRDFDGYRTDAEEEQLMKVEDVISENILMYGKDLWGYLKPFKVQVFKGTIPVKAKVDNTKYIDELLDTYNDYKRLAETFDDVSFQLKAEEVLAKLQDASLFIQ